MEVSSARSPPAGHPPLESTRMRNGSVGMGDSPAEHEDGAGGGVVGQGEGLLQAELLTATVEAV